MNFFRLYSGFCDLNIESSTENFKEICERLIELNYKIIALNQTVDNNKQDPIEPITPPPLKLTVPEHIRKKLKILNRLTIIASNPANLEKLAQSVNFRKYHLIALIPETEAVFQRACTLKLADIISFKVEDEKALFMLNRKLYNLAVDQNIYFEIPYAPLVEGTDNVQRVVICTAHKYHAVGKSKNIIVASAASNTYDVIGPYCVTALGLTLHMTKEQLHSAITRNCENLLLHAEARRFQKADNEMDADSVSEEENNTDSISIVKNDCEMRHNTNEDESHTDNEPNVKRHCPDYKMKLFKINKKVKT